MVKKKGRKRKTLEEWHQQQISKSSEKRTFTNREFLVIQAERILLDGKFSQSLKRHLTSQWDMNLSYVSLIFRVAERRIKDHWERTGRNEIIAINLERLNELYRLNKESGDYTECRNVIKDMNNLLGLNVLKLDVSNTSSTTVEKERAIIFNEYARMLNFRHDKEFKPNINDVDVV